MLINCVRDSLRVCVRVCECDCGVRDHQHEHARVVLYQALRNVAHGVHPLRGGNLVCTVCTCVCVEVVGEGRLVLLYVCGSIWAGRGGGDAGGGETAANVRAGGL